MGSTGHSNSSSSPRVRIWGAEGDPFPNPPLIQSWMASWTSGSMGVHLIPPWPVPGILLDRLPAAHKGPQSSGPGFACALGPQPAGSRHCKSLALLVGLCPPALDQYWQGHTCWGRGWDRQLSEPEQSPFPPAHGLAPLRGPFLYLTLLRQCPAFSSWLQARIFTFFRGLLLFYYSFIHSCIRYLLSSSYPPGPY